MYGVARLSTTTFAAFAGLLFTVPSSGAVAASAVAASSTVTPSTITRRSTFAAANANCTFAGIADSTCTAVRT